MTPAQTYIMILRSLQNQLAPIRVAIETAPITPEQKNAFNLHIAQLTQIIANFTSYMTSGQFAHAERAAKAAVAEYRETLLYAQTIVYPAVANAVSQSVSWERFMQSLPPNLRPPSISKIKKYLLIGGVVAIGGYFAWRSFAKQNAEKASEFVLEHPEMLALA